MSEIEILSERLRIAPFTDADAAFIVRLLNEPSFIANIADRGVRTEDDARRYLQEGPMAMYVRHGMGLCRVERRDDGAVIGMAGLIRRETLPDVDVGFAFLPEFWGQGYAVEAARACLDWGRRAHGLRRVIAVTSVGNEGSRKVLEKIGLRLEGEIAWPDPQSRVRLFGIDFPA